MCHSCFILFFLALNLQYTNIAIAVMDVSLGTPYYIYTALRFISTRDALASRCYGYGHISDLHRGVDFVCHSYFILFFLALNLQYTDLAIAVMDVSLGTPYICDYLDLLWKVGLI